MPFAFGQIGRWNWALVTVVVTLTALPAFAIGPRIVATPHDDYHLLIARPQELVDGSWKPAPLVEEPRATFNREAAPITQPLQTEIQVKHPGQYVVWARVSQRRGRPTPVHFEIFSRGQTLLAGKAQADAGADGRGGPAGYVAYQATAKQNTPKGAVASLESERFGLAGGGATGTGSAKKQPVLDNSADLGDDLLEELREKPADPWAHLARLDEQDDNQPAYWWKLGVVKLPAGRARVNVSAAGALPNKPADAPRFDALLLSTCDKLTYPFAGDINKTPATFVRFRIDNLPRGGLRLGADIHTHNLQHPRLSVRFGRDVIDKDDLFTEPGWTCWYRLQDIKWMPEATKHEVGIRINVNGAQGIYSPAEKYGGATQFASFPHADYVAREFDWSEPLALNYTCALDVAHYPHRLMTFRDHAREHYRTALNAARRVSPLVRGELYFTTICGSMGPEDRDYLLKTIRLLGMNSLSETNRDGLGERLFGWNRAAFAATMPLGDLFDERAARAHYDKYFSGVFAQDEEGWKNTWSYCYFDEPGELYREQMTGPYWQYVDDAAGPYWFDPVGDSALHIKQDNLPEECVLEGIVERTSQITFRLGLDDLQDPRSYRIWMLGNNLGPAINSNLAYGPFEEGLEIQRIGYRYARALGTNLGKLKFKIVYQKGVATLFINDRTIDQQVDLPLRPSFGIAGGPKKIYALRLRPLRVGEGVSLDAEEDESEAAELGRAVLEELELEDLPAWARAKPLRQFVEEECLFAGGVRGVAPAFRQWLREQNLQPAFFGKESWEELRPLTLAKLARDEHESRLYYWSRRFSSQLTPRNFSLISEAIHKHAPNKQMWSYAALSGGVIYRAKQMPLDMFHVGSLGNTATGGISDWMFYSTWRWDSQQAVAYSAELYSTGARRHGERPVSFPMMHCVSPNTFRAFTQLGAQVKLMSLYSYGPHYLNYPDSWAEGESCYDAIARLTARAAPADDILSTGLRRPSRVALLYPHSTEYWSTGDSFDDRRATFLALSHDYYQPEVVTEQQVENGALQHYDALYVVDRHVARASQRAIADWVEQGGMLWACADALTRDEYNQPADPLPDLVGLRRAWSAEQTIVEPERNLALAPPEPHGPRVLPATADAFRPHRVLATGVPNEIQLGEGFTRLASYEDGRPAWIERNAKQGRVVYVGHRAGATYTSKNILVSGHRSLWARTGRELLTGPLLAQRISRELSLSEPEVVASPITSEAGTAIVLYNMRPGSLAETQVRLRESVRPHSVTHLVAGELHPLPFIFADGFLTITLPMLEEEDIIYVRRVAIESDDRLAAMQDRTQEQLASDEIESLSAGAWMAGFHPQWNLAERVASLLDHADWRVRRSAAEAIGMLRYQPGEAQLAALAAKETDAHVLAEQLRALALFRHAALADLCRPYRNDSRFVARQAAIESLALMTLAEDNGAGSTELSPALREAVTTAAQAALSDTDQRVRRPAMRILARLQPTEAARQMLLAYDLRDPVAELDRPLWAEAVAGEDAAFAALKELSPKFTFEQAIDLGQHRREDSLALSLVEQVANLTTDNAFRWSTAMKRQKHPQAARRLLTMREKLPERALYYLPLVLETTFEAGLGNTLDDWEAELE